jgi:hypothetical protein
LNLPVVGQQVMPHCFHAKTSSGQQKKQVQGDRGKNQRQAPIPLQYSFSSSLQPLSMSFFRNSSFNLSTKTKSNTPLISRSHHFGKYHSEQHFLHEIWETGCTFLSRRSLRAFGSRLP